MISKISILTKFTSWSGFKVIIIPIHFFPSFLRKTNGFKEPSEVSKIAKYVTI